MSIEFVSLKELADEMAIDRSVLRKYVLKMGLQPHRRRTSASAWQPTLCLLPEEADAVRLQRQTDGFSAEQKPVRTEEGHFYVIRLVPELDHRRVKLGFAESVQERLAQHRTAAPTAELVRAWPCRRSWERTIMDAMTARDCTLIRNEVFECHDVEALIVRGDRLFEMMPVPGQQVPVARSTQAA